MIGYESGFESEGKEGSVVLRIQRGVLAKIKIAIKGRHPLDLGRDDIGIFDNRVARLLQFAEVAGYIAMFEEALTASIQYVDSAARHEPIAIDPQRFEARRIGNRIDRTKHDRMVWILPDERRRRRRELRGRKPMARIGSKQPIVDEDRAVD